MSKQKTKFEKYGTPGAVGLALISGASYVLMRRRARRHLLLDDEPWGQQPPLADPIDGLTVSEIAEKAASKSLNNDDSDSIVDKVKDSARGTVRKVENSVKPMPSPLNSLDADDRVLVAKLDGANETLVTEIVAPDKKLTENLIQEGIIEPSEKGYALTERGFAVAKELANDSSIKERMVEMKEAAIRYTAPMLHPKKELDERVLKPVKHKAIKFSVIGFVAFSLWIIFLAVATVLVLQLFGF